MFIDWFQKSLYMTVKVYVERRWFVPRLGYCIEQGLNFDQKDVVKDMLEFLHVYIYMWDKMPWRVDLKDRTIHGYSYRRIKYMVKDVMCSYCENRPDDADFLREIEECTRECLLEYQKKIGA